MMRCALSPPYTFWFATLTRLDVCPPLTTLQATIFADGNECFVSVCCSPIPSSLRSFPYWRARTFVFLGALCLRSYPHGVIQLSRNIWFVGAVIKYAEYIMGVVFKLRMMALSPQVVADENGKKTPHSIKFTDCCHPPNREHPSNW